MAKHTLGDLVDDQAIQKLKNRQRDLNMKNADLARSIGVKQFQLDQWRSRKESPTLPQLSRWAELLGMQITLVIEEPKSQRPPGFRLNSSNQAG